MLNKAELKELYDEVSNIILFTTKEKNLLHLGSIKNFLTHYNELKDQYQLDVSQKIETYLNFIKENRYTLLTERNESITLFVDYIHPIGKIYVSQLGFSFESKLWIVITRVVFLIIVLFLLNIFLLNVAVALFLFWYFYRFQKRKKNGKFYGMGY